jgi:hypothetical protein
VRRLIALVALLTVGCTPWVDAPGHMRVRELVTGGQAEIDQGYAVNYLGCWPDQGCTVFLAGHRTTHGSVFAGVAGLQAGDMVRIGYGGGVYLYRVTEHVIETQHQRVMDVLGGDLVLQTSAGSGRVHLVYCELMRE